jgi:hypothetical protein
MVCNLHRDIFVCRDAHREVASDISLDSAVSMPNNRVEAPREEFQEASFHKDNGTPRLARMGNEPVVPLEDDIPSCRNDSGCHSRKVDDTRLRSQRIPSKYSHRPDCSSHPPSLSKAKTSALCHSSISSQSKRHNCRKDLRDNSADTHALHRAVNRHKLAHSSIHSHNSYPDIVSQSSPSHKSKTWTGPYDRTVDKVPHDRLVRKDADNGLLLVSSKFDRKNVEASRQWSGDRFPSDTSKCSYSAIHPSVNCSRDIAIV